MKTRTPKPFPRSIVPWTPPLPRLAAALALLLLGLGLGSAAVSAAPTVATGKATYDVGENIVVTFAGGPGNPKDWIGIYRSGQTPGQGGVTSTLWNYVDGTRDGNTGVASGTMTFPGGLSAAGDWVVYLLENDGYTQLAMATFKVASSQPPPAVVPTVLPDHAAYFPGEDIRISFANGPGNARDWIGVYPPEVEPGGPASTLWNYVGGTQTPGASLKEGTVTFAGGLNLAGDWVVYLLENDGYTKLATNSFAVLDPGAPAVRLGKRVYATGETITATFTNGFANPKDWVGIYRAGQTPGQGGVTSTLWLYVDGTENGTSGRANGTLTFPNGLDTTGEWVAFFLLNDGYDVLASESFTVVTPVAAPRILALSPAPNSSNVPPAIEFSASITNGTSRVVTNSIALTLDGVAVTPEITQQGDLVRVRHSGSGLLAPGSAHTWLLTFQDNASPPADLRAESRFSVGEYRNVVLPAPVYFENFDAVAEGSLPAGWTTRSYTMPINEAVDFGDLGSAAYQQWTAVNADRFEGSFVTYGNPDNPPGWGTDYQRVLSVNPFAVLNGRVLNEPLAQGRFLFGNSGYQNSAASQVLYLFTPDFNLVGKTNVQVSFKSLWEQNQDSLGAVEYSIDGGQNWLPIAYFLDGPDIVRNEDGTIDAETTFYAEHGDVARYVDELGNEIGGTYGAFIAAPISPALAPFIQARVNDDPVESKRVEWFRLPQADNQARVRLRFAHAGTDSWYFGIDDFGVYAPVDDGPPPTLAIARDGAGVVLSWPAAASGYTLESTAALVPANWQAVPGVSGNSHRVTPEGPGAFYRLRR